MRQGIGRAYIGTSGWSYAGWRDDFYAGVPRRNWLVYAASRFSGLEINASFYRLQQESTFRRWREATPKDFRFALKANRYLTHNRKLREPVEPIRTERERARALGDRLAVVLWQLPPNFGRHLERLQHFAEALSVAWPEVRHAVEFRHPSWFDDEVAACLHEHRLALCLSDAADWPLWDRVTTDLVYLRLHGHSHTYASAYSTPDLHRWAERIRGWLDGGRDVHVYFDNDAEGAAPRDALRLLALLNGPLG